MTLLSIIIPCYNEEQRLGPTLDSIAEYAAARVGETEVIVVDDGSRDATTEVAHASSCPNLRVLETSQNRGKGHAVRVGMKAAAGDFRLFTDADGSTPIEELAALDKALDEMGGSGVAFASIGAPGAKVTRTQRGLRPAAGRFGNWLIRLIALPGVWDSQRGFKLFSADAAEAIFSRAVVDRWAFDVELLAIARHLGFSIAEVPVTWAHKDDSRVTALSYLSTFLDVVRIRLRLVRGSYDTP
ncbi:MAG: glycosyltransferase family 2 protein [Acidimicrobiia bacterium]|nr:glycosyltransferase family 2 protein [Acidimicrobiia bacterium]